MSIDMRDSQTPEPTGNNSTNDLTNCTVVTEVTVEMILNDLAQGRNKEQIRQKYAYKDENGTVRPFEKWMVDQMFKDPALRGKKPARKKVLPFVFKGSTTTAAPTTSGEPKYGIPGTEGGHQMTDTTSDNGYVEIIDTEKDDNHFNTY